MIDIFHEAVIVKDIPQPDHPVKNATDLAETNSGVLKGGPYKGMFVYMITYLPFDTFLDNVQFTGSVILLHEMFHAVDHLLQFKKQTNYLSVIDPFNPLYKFNSQLYDEARTTLIENQFRVQSGQSNLGIRKMYGGVDLTRWYDFKTNSWYNK